MGGLDRRVVVAAAAVLVAILVVAVGIVALRPHSSAPAAATATASSRPSPSASPTPRPSPTPVPDPCAQASVGPPTQTLSVPFPTAIAFAPDGRLFIAERAGTIAVAAGNAVTTFTTVPTVTTEANGSYSERGLLGLAVSPGYAHDHFVFAMYSSADRSQQVIERWTDCAGQATAATVIARFPAGPDCCHKGGRLGFGPDGYLYASLGDEHTASAAQNTGDVRGKILRLGMDGSAAPGNPFGNMVWAAGLRNPFGFTFGPDGTMVISSNGPSGDAGSPPTGYDLLLAAHAGTRFQWPDCYGYSHPLAAASCGDLTAPVWSSEQSTYVPTGIAWADASAPAPYANHFVLCTYERGMFVVNATSPHWSLTPAPGTCTLDAVEGPDHAIYTTDTSHVYRNG